MMKRATLYPLCSVYSNSRPTELVLPTTDGGKTINRSVGGSATDRMDGTLPSSNDGLTDGSLPRRSRDNAAKVSLAGRAAPAAAAATVASASLQRHRTGSWLARTCIGWRVPRGGHR